MLRRIIPTAERTVTRGGDKKNIDEGDAIRERLSVGKGFLELLHSAGWCGHVSGLIMRPYHLPLAIMPFARPGSRSQART
jgi:hypothetical protein